MLHKSTDKMHQQEKQKTPIEADFSSSPMSGFMLLLLNKHEVFPEVFPISYKNKYQCFTN